MAKLLRCTFLDKHTLPTALLTFQLQYPRFIHAQVLMHRMFARNAASNRARSLPPIPPGCDLKGAAVARLTYVPKPRLRDKGMQVLHDVSYEQAERFREAWLSVAETAYKVAYSLQAQGYAKELVNRLVEPFQMIEVVMTGQYKWWEHFCKLRLGDEAQLEIKELAHEIAAALEAVRKKRFPDKIHYEDWHIPYLLEDDREELNRIFDDNPTHSLWAACAIASARCARVSYTPFGNLKRNLTNDLQLFIRLVTAEPMHASPLEHIASPARHDESSPSIFPGWTTFRAIWERTSEVEKQQFIERCGRVINGS